MTHAGKARQAGLKLIVLSLFIVGLVLGVWSFLAGTVLTLVAVSLGVIWGVFVIFCLNFFRDPDPAVLSDAKAIISPAHGTVDVIDETLEKTYLGGPCRRISIFLSVFDVHIQNAPVAGRVAYLQHTPGQFLNAMRTDCGSFNENVLIGFESLDRPSERVSVRLIAGLIARRIVPWVSSNDEVTRGQRISLIQFGSRVDLYLPMQTRIKVNLGQKVKGGQSIVAVLE
jgi:phosphatidylserine decarboxylase